MRNFSFALRCRTFDQFYSGKRFVSYKVRENLVTVLTNIMTEAQTSGLLRSAAEKSSQHCSHFSVNVLGNGASGSKSICIQTSLQSYLFNCGEGMQRLAVEHGQKLFKTRSVFITYHSWNNIGGIMGLCLTLQSQGVKKLIIYGPPPIRDIISALRLFVALKNLSVVIITENPRLSYDDSLLKVQFVPIYAHPPNIADKTISEEKIASSSQGNEDLSDCEEPSRKRRCHSESRARNNLNENYCLCYLCETPEFGSTLDAKKCSSLGVPQGPLFGVLKGKSNVVLPNGKVIRWEEVYKNKGKPEFFLVVDCPTEEFLDSFVKELEVMRFHGSAKQPVAAVIHFTEPEIMNNLKYQEWMSRFPPTTCHMKLNRSNRVLDHIAAYRLQEKLHFIDPQIFPRLSEDNFPEIKEELSGKYNPNLRLIARIDGSQKSQPKKVSGEPSSRSFAYPEDFLKPGFKETEIVNGMSVISPFSTFRWTICPQMEENFSYLAFLDRNNCLKEILDINNIHEKMKELRELKMKWDKSKECMKLLDYPKILFLGTGSSTPCALRNTSAILIEIEKNHLVLLDCGEGTYGQMLRFFGKERIKDIIKRLRLIYVSHQHADHHLGLINLLDARYRFLSACTGKVYENEFCPDACHLTLLLPPSVRDWVHSNDKFNTLLYDARILITSGLVKSYNIIRRLTNNLGISDLKMITVPHSFESFGVSFNTRSGYKITYSGDSMPSDNLIEIGKKCDLLIHEATFEDGMEAMAKHKRHSTVSQALEVGKRMQANFIMLTHFSQRYSHLPQLNSELPENVGIAFDNMMVTPKTLPFLTNLLKFYKMIFADKINDLNSKTVKRILREETEKWREPLRMKL